MCEGEAEAATEQEKLAQQEEISPARNVLRFPQMLCTARACCTNTAVSSRHLTGRLPALYVQPCCAYAMTQVFVAHGAASGTTC